MTIVRAYVAAGAPRPDIPIFGRFEAWSRFAREPLVWLGLEDPSETRRVVEGRDTVRKLLGNLLEAWHASFDTTAQTVRAAIQFAETNDPLRDALEAVGEERGKINARRIGKFLSKHDHRIERGYRLEQAGDRQGVALWRVTG